MTDEKTKTMQGKRLAQARLSAGWRSARSAALENGWAESTYRAHENGSRTIGQDDAEAYAKRFRAAGVAVTARDILFGWEAPLPTRDIPVIQSFEDFERDTETMMRGEEPRPVPTVRTPYVPEPNKFAPQPDAYLPARASLPRDVPELGVTVGGRGDDDSVFELNGTPVDYHTRPPGLMRRPNVFVLRVSNSSMSPRFEDGETEFIELKNPSVGEYVVVELKPEVEDGAGRSYIKKLVKADARKITVEQFNPPGYMEFGRDEIHRLFRVITDKKELIG